MNETVTASSMSRRRFFKRTARTLLYNDWICQIFAIFIVGALSSGIRLFGMNLCSVMLTVTENQKLTNFFGVVYLMLGVLLMLPLYYGLLHFEKQMLMEGKGKISDIFYCYSSLGELNHAYSVIFGVAWRVVLCFLPMIVLNLFEFVYYYEGYFGFIMRYSSIDLVGTAIRTLIVVFGYLGFVFSSKYFVTLYISHERPEISVREAVMISKVCMYGSGFESVGLALSFLPLVVLSIFSMGFLFLLFTFPYMLITFVVFSKYLYEKEMYTRNAHNLLYSDNENEN